MQKAKTTGFSSRGVEKANGWKKKKMPHGTMHAYDDHNNGSSCVGMNDEQSV